MNTTGMPEGFIADPEWLQGIALACRHTVDMIHSVYGTEPGSMSRDEIAQLNIASAYLYLYNSAIQNENLDVMVPKNVTWH